MTAMIDGHRQGHIGAIVYESFQTDDPNEATEEGIRHHRRRTRIGSDDEMEEDTEVEEMVSLFPACCLVLG